MEFTGSNGDRYLFPRYSILEFAPEAKCIIASFLVVRGLNSTSTTTASTTSKPQSTTNKKPSISSTTSTPIKTEVSTPTPANKGPVYHQPVTMRITADNAKVFEQISRTVSSLDEARRHMEDIMTKTKRAEDVVLALRLPIAEGEEAAPGTPGADAALRRGSMALLKGLGAGMASPGGSEQSKKKKAKVEEVCGYCFTPVGTTGHGLETTEMIGCEPVCQSCAALLRKSGKMPPMRSTGMKVTRKVEGPKILMLGY